MSSKVLLVCGSIQQESTNKVALASAVASCERMGLSAQNSVDLGLIAPFNPDNQLSSGSSEAGLCREIAESDAVIISTPEYAAAIPGMLKNALDWVVGSGDLNGKLVGVMSASASGGEHVLAQLIRTLTWQGAHVVARLSIPAPKAKIVDGVVAPETQSDIDSFVQELVQVLGMGEQDRMSRVYEVTGAVGIDNGNVAPMV